MSTIDTSDTICDVCGKSDMHNLKHYEITLRRYSTINGDYLPPHTIHICADHSLEEIPPHHLLFEEKPLDKTFYCPNCDDVFIAAGYPNPVFYADTVANCPVCNGKCWEKTVKITLSEYGRLKSIGSEPKLFN